LQQYQIYAYHIECMSKAHMIFDHSNIGIIGSCSWGYALLCCVVLCR